MKIAFLSALLVFLFSGCTNQPTPNEFKGPNGNKGYSLDCGTNSKDLAKCYQVASELCPNGYNTLSQNSKPVGVPSMYGTIVASIQSLVIECK